MGVFDGAIAETTLPEALHPFIDVNRFQFGEHDPTNQWNHIRLDVITIVLPGAERNTALGLVVLKKAFQEVGKRSLSRAIVEALPAASDGILRLVDRLFSGHRHHGMALAVREEIPREIYPVVLFSVSPDLECAHGFLTQKDKTPLSAKNQQVAFWAALAWMPR